MTRLKGDVLLSLSPSIDLSVRQTVGNSMEDTGGASCRFVGAVSVEFLNGQFTVRLVLLCNMQFELFDGFSRF
jgi:hypothetical protein